jgi:hypothetical protein
MATRFAEESIEIRRENQRRREDQVLKETGTIRSERRIFKRACKHFGDRGEGKG